MNLRDETETTLRAWNTHEVNRGASPIIDFDCHPTGSSAAAEPATSRLAVHRRLTELRQGAEDVLAARLDADLTHLAAGRPLRLT